MQRSWVGWPEVPLWGCSGTGPGWWTQTPPPQPVAFHDHGLTQDPQHTATGQVSKERLVLDQWERGTQPIPHPRRSARHASRVRSQARRHCGRSSPLQPRVGGTAKADNRLSVIATERDDGRRGRGRVGAPRVGGTMGDSGPGERRRTRTCLSSAGSGGVGGRVGVRARAGGRGKDRDTR